MRVRSLFPLLLLAVAAAAHAGTAVVTHTGDSGAGSLRAAMEAANSGACASPCAIVFNIAGAPEAGGVFTIAPLTALPFLSTDAVIDGATQTAFSGDTNPLGPEIVISGVNACSGSDLVQCRGLQTARASAFRNLVVNGWSRPDTFGVGFYLAHHQAWATEVSGNYIGTDPTGTFAVPNDRGIELRISGATIRDNVISGNNLYGIYALRSLSFTADGNRIIGNYVGTNRLGNAPLPNGVGIAFFGTIQPTGNVIGTVAPGEGNLIAFNTSYGIELGSGAGCANTIRGNSIHSNGDQGIKHIAPGFPPSNPPAPCTVVRYAPQLTSLAYNPATNQTTVTGSFHGYGNLALTLDWYTNRVADPSGYGEGETYYATRNVVTDAQGHWSVQLPGDLRNTNLVATTTESSFSNIIGSYADLRVNMTEEHGGVVSSETRLRYTITIQNLGPDEATHVRVHDHIPSRLAAVEVVSAGWSCVRAGDGDDLLCTMEGSLPAHATATLIIQGVPAEAGITLTNRADVSAAEEDRNPANNSASVTTMVRPLAADIFVEHQGRPAAIETGGLIAYELRIGNNGPDSEPAVTLTTSVTNGVVESVRLVGGSMQCSGTQCTVGEIASGDQRIVIVSVRAPSSTGWVSHTATVSGVRNDPVTTNDATTAWTQVYAKKRRAVRH